MTKSFALKLAATSLVLASNFTYATGMLPETSVVLIEESDGEGTIDVKNTDKTPVLLTTTLENIPQDTEELLIVNPPVARVEPGKSQRVRFMLTTQTPLKTERLKRVIFEGVPPQEKDKNALVTTVRQNLPVIIRPAGLAVDYAPWKHLTWSIIGDQLVVSNQTAYVVRMNQGVQSLPDNGNWKLSRPYVLPGETLTLSADGKTDTSKTRQVRLFPATSWGGAVGAYETSLSSPKAP